MKKTIIATKNVKTLGLHQVILVLNTNDCAIELEEYYNGKIYRKETTYYEDNLYIEVSWDNEVKYYQENEYVMIKI